mmetsp:Transcript_155532/g.497318  ORF Transcript_155532/g.497318 Transcript_155532/m.497318 type:complete len:231 (+) Transcript_155532:414-1106(+)
MSQLRRYLAFGPITNPCKQLLSCMVSPPRTVPKSALKNLLLARRNDHLSAAEDDPPRSIELSSSCHTDQRSRARAPSASSSFTAVGLRVDIKDNPDKARSDNELWASPPSATICSVSSRAPRGPETGARREIDTNCWNLLRPQSCRLCRPHPPAAEAAVLPPLQLRWAAAARSRPSSSRRCSSCFADADNSNGPPGCSIGTGRGEERHTQGDGTVHFSSAGATPPTPSLS